MKQLKIVITTEAPEDYIDLVMSRVKTSLKEGYVTGQGFVKKLFDESDYRYEFHYGTDEEISNQSYR